ncbi:MAG: hypothetical protein ACK5NC_08690 [Vibrio sp.]
MFKKSTLSVCVASALLVLNLSACDGGSGGSSSHSESGQDSRTQYETTNPFDYIVSSDDPNAPQWNQSLNNGTGGYEPKAEDSREVVVLDDTFKVDAGEEKHFENKIIYIRATDDQIHKLVINGTLSFTNCLLLWDQNVEEQLPFYVTGLGQLTLTNSYAFSHTGSWIAWKFTGSSIVNLDHFQGTPWTTITDQVEYSATNYSTVHMTILNATNGASVKVDQSHSVWLEIYPMSGDSSIELSKNNIWNDLNLDQMWANTTFDIEDSYIYEQDIALRADVNLTVENATDGFGLGWEVSKDSFVGLSDENQCLFDGLGDPAGRGMGAVLEDKEWQCGNSSLHIVNSKILTAWPDLSDDVNLTVTNSYLVDPRMYGQNLSNVGTYTIKDSTAEAPMALTGGKMYLENVKILNTLNVNGANSLIQGYKVTSFDPQTPYTLNTSDGGVYQELTEAL